MTGKPYGAPPAPTWKPTDTTLEVVKFLRGVGCRVWRSTSDSWRVLIRVDGEAQTLSPDNLLNLATNYGYKLTLKQVAARRDRERLTV